ncbi:asparaginase [Blastococcus colisei]|uniref:Asparaginase n=1 Tax=Blastococcus colisei TaxID=1564162 RepID=A0A543PHC6_9ACTN|nr:asparaginase [Blastococcus colisei]TQN43483.1 asparaginase [Blastococcus colisei]
MTGRSRPLVAFGSLGGTITMTPFPSSGGIEPRLTAEDLAASVPGLDGVAEVRVATLARVPSASLLPQDVVDAVAWAREQVAAGAAGVVLAQGTDTLEETSFLAGLYWDLPEPLVVTGAMRGPAQASPDGPANLLAACRVATAPAFRDAGVLVVLDDTVHAARTVRKTHSWSLGAFHSADGGPVGQVVEGAVHVHRLPRRGAPLPRPRTDPDVPLLETFLGDDGALLRTVREHGARGVAISAFGAGHTSTGLAEEISTTVAAGIPVVVSTRTGAGGTLTGTYGFAGSEIDLQARGAVLTGALDARKSRLLLWALLAGGVPRERVTGHFLEHSGR